MKIKIKPDSKLREYLKPDDDILPCIVFISAVIIIIISVVYAFLP